MRLQAMVVMVALTGANFKGSESVTICMQPAADLSFGLAEQQARPIVSKMFADIGVGIKWRDGLSSCPAAGIQISFSTNTPRDLRPGALAYSLPYEGVHVEVFSDRVKEAVQPILVPSLLAHVLAQEITHLLQGIDRHSDSGVMKASWDESDYCQMARKPLPFTEKDVALIHRGLAGSSRSGSTGGGNASEPGDGPEFVVPVYLNRGSEDPFVFLQAEVLAGKMFASAGVKIDWCNGVRSCLDKPGVIIVSLGGPTRSTFSTEGLAAARPYEGTHIEIAYDRLKETLISFRPILLAHVLVHEITHIMQGISRHSKTGVMKAHWDDADFGVMVKRPLPFTANDIELIHMGLEKRASRAAAASTVASQ